MHSRAYFLLEREYLEYKEDNIFGIFVTPIKDNLLEWLAEVQGLKDSLWEGAVLQLSIKYTEEYNSVPPTVMFNTIPFHPNVDQHSGRPCIDFLENPKEWNGKLTMSSILLAVQVMLSNPELENAVNVEAAEMLKNNISLYRQMVIQCVRTSQHLEDLSSTGKVCASSPKYYLPSEASSRGHVRYNAIVSQLIRKQRQQTIDEKLIEIRKMEQDNNLLYQTPEPESQAAGEKRPLSKEEEPWESEVDNLVAWTNTLCTKGLED
ncbi:ubiquitin-conjugating enzyme E2 U isoform X3 [Caretta caretta]|uniref:ubiquitin-conjugating enzyme E2 U isoform X3 n=1 Tax=Caretta caretta TaxID=8467 RepID=UPI002094CCEB|nr:ubiquitin-conjugating enzyme E2 U isoform X3 [Caretta caretta]